MQGNDWEKKLKGNQISNIKRIKNGKWYKTLIEQGFTPFTEEWRAKVKALNYEDRYKNDPEYKKRRNERRNEKRKQNLEESRRKDREKKRRLIAGREEEFNAKQRAYYDKNRLVNAAKQRERRHIREPHRAIRANVELYRKGLLTHEQFVKSVDECVERAKQAEHTGLGRRAERRKKEGEAG